MGCAKALLHRSGQFLHGLGIRNINQLGHDLHAHGFDLIVCHLEGVFLHIDQHHIHAQRGTQTGAFQAKARSPAG